jgi:alpha/beta superfamily hydrolase
MQTAAHRPSGDATGVVRVDSATGVSESLTVIGTREDRLAAAMYLPVGPPRAALVACPPICIDFLRQYHREAVAARTLAAAGVAVLRFHYRGTGDSDGEPAALTFDTMREDALDALAQLTDTCPDAPVAFLGTRFAAPVAAAAAVASGRPGARLVLVEPNVKLSQFFREGLRARMATAISQHGAGTTTKDLVDELHRVGVIDILGQSIHLPLYESANDRTLAGELGSVPRPLLWVQFGTDGDVRPAYATAIRELEQAGFPSDVARVGTEEFWWFLDPIRRHEQRQREGADERGDAAGHDLGDAIGRWLDGTGPAA